jgi:hypothetical protein
VSNIWFLLSIEQVAMGTHGSSLSVWARWSDLLFLQGGSCIALMLQCYNSVWSAPPPARWSNSVFSIALSPTRLAQRSAYPHLGKLACHPSPTLSSCSSPFFLSLRVWFLAPLPFSKIGLVFHPTPTLSCRLQVTLYVFQFFFF